MDQEFTLEEARALVPVVRQLLESARSDLAELSGQLKDANEKFLEAEWEVRQARLKSGSDEAFASDRRWKRTAAKLETVKKQLRERTQGWLADINGTGILLRDLNHGLVDFPGRDGDTEVYWCWHLGEETVTHWHTRQEGFANRKSVGNIRTLG